MEAGPAWHPRTAVSRRQRLGLDPRRGDAARSATGRRTATAARDHPTARAKSGRCREFKLSENVQAAGAWREHIEKEEMPVGDLLACVARCRVPEHSLHYIRNIYMELFPTNSPYEDLYGETNVSCCVRSRWESAAQLGSRGRGRSTCQTHLAAGVRTHHHLPLSLSP